MPTCRRKRVLLTEPSQALLDALQTDSNKEVYYLTQTGEIFETYDAYASRMSFYRMKHFQCEVTGKSGLDYFQALESEQQEARTMHSRFPEPLKAAVLKAVQWQVMGRLDHLVEAVYERFKDRYFPDERVIVDLQGDKYYAQVVQVFPPRQAQIPARQSPDAQASSSSSPLSDEEPIHKIAEDLKISVKDAAVRDDPNKYYYKVQILEEEKQPGSGKGTERTKAKDPKATKWSRSLMDTRCCDMSRDRLAFSKSILRRFIRDCVDREAAVASPWTVKPAIAARYGVNSVMPEETRIGVESIKKGEIDKRKKVWEEKEGPALKKQKRLAAAEEEKAKAAAAAAERREREAREKAEKLQKAKEEKERLDAEKKKKKPVRYPTEDLDVTIGEKEKKAGMQRKKPAPSRIGMPFGKDHSTNEAFIMAWNFLVVYGQPLHLSTFSMDDFEQAIRHSVLDPPCPLIAEVHSTLIYNLRTVPFSRQGAIQSLKDDDSSNPRECLGVSIDPLAEALEDIGNNWERAPLRHAELRNGWEESLIGCLKDHATIENFPKLREILTRLLFAPEPPSESDPSTSTSPAPSPYPTALSIKTPPGQRYHTLLPEDKITILSFLCNLAVSSKAIHAHMENCEEMLTALRKEKIEVNRNKKQFAEEMAALVGESKEGTPKTNGVEDEAGAHESSELSEVPGSDAENGGLSSGKRAKESRRKTQAKERELARAKLASAKQAIAEHRRLDEEVNKLERRLEGIEREFRKLLGAVRVKPLGRDRFYNRIWWFDGMGSASLIGSGGTVQYGTGRIFIQGPSEFDIEVVQRRDEDVTARRLEEEGEEGTLGVGEWAVYDDIETVSGLVHTSHRNRLTAISKVDQFVAWLNPKGVRELALKNTFTKWWPHIGPGMRRRSADLANTAKLPEARRSARTKHPGSDISREPYMLWTNRRAVNSS